MVLFSVNRVCREAGEADGLVLRLVAAHGVDPVFVGDVDFVVFS